MFTSDRSPCTGDGLRLLNAADDGDDSRRNFRRELDADLVEYDVTERRTARHVAFDGCLVTGLARPLRHVPWIRASIRGGCGNRP